MPPKHEQTLRHLRELIAALDWRVPQVQRLGEAEIAREAAKLKAAALLRIAELEREMALETNASERREPPGAEE
jgi:hypothetical protein